ncbi:fimbrial protein [Salmonella enterica subsp. enterica serovar Newport]|nr:fimbrial protein [Salmonella enterica subsp. enterica serovar Newport]EHK8785514.1 fimbrial protein [Salmonella enterica subsp. enterica serovar Bardo]ELC2954317.1 fimbrial protein [Salmonella enterica]EDL3511566.1 fimbrial protein [Salmonella enterica subsp. enterica serovar Newport]EGK6997748.1 fimbrial protein [Salmonella enterica subsp. enterica serovar Newport]
MVQHIKVLIIISLLISGPLHAENLTINVSGSIYIPPCTFNEGQNIEVDFGDMAIDRISDASVWKKKEVKFNCAFSEGTPYIRMTGVQLTGADSHVLRTSISHFGIALYQGEGASTPLRLGDGVSNGKDFIGYPITRGLSGASTGSFIFTAVPYIITDIIPEAGAFTASVSMNISYL